MRITKMFVRRRTMNLTQAQLAAEIGVTQPRISAWENGRADVPPKRAAMIAKLLDLDPAELTDEA